LENIYTITLINDYEITPCLGNALVKKYENKVGDTKAMENEASALGVTADGVRPKRHKSVCQYASVKHSRDGGRMSGTYYFIGRTLMRHSLSQARLGKEEGEE
jgi:hypothetical protein